jgi:photosystem II stability/assembly factor-like uncharacterized protein
MKKFYILLVALLMVNGAMGQWFQLNTGTIKVLYSVYFKDVNTGYAVGDSGIILKTSDGGTNWTQQSSGVNSALFSVHFVSSTTGYVVGELGVMLKTTNGGTDWELKNIRGATTLSSVYFPSIDTGYVVGIRNVTSINLGVIFKTTDGGNNWNQIYSTADGEGLNSVFFLNAELGFSVGDNGIIVKSDDGGANWTKNTIGTSALKSIHFTSIDWGYIVGCDDNGDASILKTIDGGVNWTSHDLENYCLNSIFFVDTNVGYAVGTHYNQGTIIRSNDGGINWSEQYSVLNYPLNSIFFPNKDTGYAVCTNGTLLKTTNGGGLGINEKGISLNGLDIYPNPTSAIITIETLANGSLSILNISGQQLLQQEITEPITTIDVSTLPSGVYVVKVVGDKGVQVGKIVKQ